MIRSAPGHMRDISAEKIKLNMSNLYELNKLTNIDVAKQICQIINDNFNLKHDCLELIKYVDDRLGHDFRYAIDSTKIRENLQWKPNYSFNDGLIKTIDYYKENL